MTRVSLCLLLMVGSLAAEAAQESESIGRLFFTPTERNALEAGKSVRKSAPVARGPQSVQVNGVVTRSDSQRTVWVNGKAYHDGSPEGIQVTTNPGAPASTSIRIPGRTAAARVKVGQRLDLNSGRIQEDFTRRPAATESAVAPAENPASRPSAIARKTRAAGDTAPQIRQPETSASKGEEATGEIGRDAPAAAR
jgi:hypothetical protein